jgi:hypothetical protein
MIPIIIYDSGTQSIIWIDPEEPPEWLQRLEAENGNKSD